MKKLLILFSLFLTNPFVNAQSFKFAHVSDTHIGSNNAADDLRRTVSDINSNDSLKFVVITGDITDFGADKEIYLAKQILDSLNKPWYIIPGNHDANWSESGSNTFKKVFGSETFSFTYGGYLFAGTGSGPNMRMGPGQVPRENIVWLDSVLNHMEDPQMPVVYLNHYPQDSSQNNCYEVMNKLKKKNIQLILCGHGHQNHEYTFEGVPAIMGRSNLRAKDSVGGYNIVTFSNGLASFELRKPLGGFRHTWATVDLANHHFEKDTSRYFRPSFAVNKTYPNVKVVWTYQNNSDLGTGVAASDKLLFSTNTAGDIYALNKMNGRQIWKFHTKGKVYSTPDYYKNLVVAGSSDGNVYCLNALTGKLIWSFKTDKAVVASPRIENSMVYIGASDGKFRAINLYTGKLAWSFDDVAGFVVDKPLSYNGNVYFGCWANDFYSLNEQTGQLQWKWSNGSANRMFSPAVCLPVATQNRLFIVAPDRYMTCLKASDGTVIWRRQMPGIRVRESLGLSADSSLVYVKTMDGQLLGISTKADSMTIAWRSKLQLPYELCPAAIIEKNNVIYVPTHSGLVCAVDRRSGNVLWMHKVSNCLVNAVVPLDQHFVVVSTMDGKLTCLRYQ